jgi:hypothetical protein
MRTIYELEKSRFWNGIPCQRFLKRGRTNSTCRIVPKFKKAREVKLIIKSSINDKENSLPDPGKGVRLVSGIRRVRLT